MNSRERVLTALSHRAPDRVPIDFGSTAVTGMHVSCVAALRDYYGLDKQRVKAHEPYQMLGLIEEDLKQALGLDVDGVSAPKTMFGFPNRDWKPWRMPDGLEILVSAEFRVTTDNNGDTLIYPEGDLSAPPSGRMPKDGYFFDTIIRQQPIEDEKLVPEDNFEEFSTMPEQDLQDLAAAVRTAAASGRAVMVNTGGNGLRRYRPRPSSFSQTPARHPRRHRVVHLDPHATRPDPQDLHTPERNRARQPEAFSRGGRRRGRRDLPLRHRLRHPDLHILFGRYLQRALPSVLPEAQ